RRPQMQRTRRDLSPERVMRDRLEAIIFERAGFERGDGAEAGFRFGQNRLDLRGRLAADVAAAQIADPGGDDLPAIKRADILGAAQTIADALEAIGILRGGPQRRPLGALAVPGLEFRPLAGAAIENEIRQHDLAARAQRLRDDAQEAL